MSSKVVFSAKNFTVEEVRDGKHVVIAPNGSFVIAMDNQNRILMTREFRPKLNKTIWRVPAGKADVEEDLLACARRELREESGYDAKTIELFYQYEGSSSLIKQVKACYIARDIFVSPLDTGDEPVKPEVHFLEAKNVLQLLNDGEVVGDIAAGLYRFLHVNKLV